MTQLWEPDAPNLYKVIVEVEGKVIDKKVYKNVTLKGGRTVNEVEAFLPKINKEGLYFVDYLVDKG